MQKLTELAEGWYSNSNCPFTRATFLDVVSLCGMSMLKRPGSKSIFPAWEELTASVSIGPEYALDIKAVTGDALLRQSLAQVFFIDRVILRERDLSQIDFQGIDEALLLLAGYDQDTCCVALDTLDQVFTLGPSNEMTIALDQVLAHVHKVLSDTTETEVISKAQAVLANGLSNPILRSGFCTCITGNHTMITLITLEHQCLFGPPSNMQSALHLLGFFLDRAHAASPPKDRTVLSATARYIRLLRMTTTDTNPFDTRFAAVQSLSALDSLWTLSPRSKAAAPLLLALSLILYDLLHDDDDEIRTLAASCTTSLFRAQGSTKQGATIPLLTSHHLALFLAATFPTSNDLANEAVRRLLCANSNSFEAVLAEARKEDTALFATEKQNLYKDDALDAMIWSRVLLSISIQTPSALSHVLHAQLSAWVSDGLSVLTDTMEKEVDGALGWSSKAEVFTLGIRVVCAAEVVVLRGSVEMRRESMEGLRKFADVCREKEGHGLWIERVERVLEKGVLGTLKAVKESLVVIE